MVFLLLLVRAVGRAEPEYRDFLAWSATTPVLSLNVVSLFFVVFHAITWFNLAPQAMVIRVGGKASAGDR